MQEEDFGDSPALRHDCKGMLRSSGEQDVHWDMTDSSVPVPVTEKAANTFLFKQVKVELHVGLTVSPFVVLKITVLWDELVRFLPLLLLQHRVSHLHIFAAEFMSGQELNDAGSDGVSQNIGGGAEAVPAFQNKD